MSKYFNEEESKQFKIFKKVHLINFIILIFSMILYPIFELKIIAWIIIFCLFVLFLEFHWLLCFMIHFNFRSK